MIDRATDPRPRPRPQTRTHQTRHHNQRRRARGHHHEPATRPSRGPDHRRRIASQYGRTRRMGSVLFGNGRAGQGSRAVRERR